MRSSVAAVDEQAATGVLLLAAIGGLVVSMRNKKRPAPEEQEEQEEHQKETPALERKKSKVQEAAEAAKSKAQGMLKFYQENIAEKVWAFSPARPHTHPTSSSAAPTARVVIGEPRHALSLSSALHR